MHPDPVDAFIHDRVRTGVRIFLEQLLEEELTRHLQAGWRERTGQRRGARNGYYHRTLATPLGRIELNVPRQRLGTFTTRVFDCYERRCGQPEKAVLEMYLGGVTTQRVSGLVQALSAVDLEQDALERLAAKLAESFRRQQQRPLKTPYSYLVVDPRTLETRWGKRRLNVPLLAAIGMDARGVREVLGIHKAAPDHERACRELLGSLLGRGLAGVRLVGTDGREDVRRAIAQELPEVPLQRSVMHFQREVLEHVPAWEARPVAEDLRVVFRAQRVSTARAFAEDFVTHYGSRFPEAVRAFERGLDEALLVAREIRTLRTEDKDPGRQRSRRTRSAPAPDPGS